MKFAQVIVLNWSILCKTHCTIRPTPQFLFFGLPIWYSCRKRYLKVEREFLDVKLCLQQKTERKEMLTEHLCTIIEKNEERKGKKLDELLQKARLSYEDTLVEKQ